MRRTMMMAIVVATGVLAACGAGSSTDQAREQPAAAPAPTAETQAVVTDEPVVESVPTVEATPTPAPTVVTAIADVVIDPVVFADDFATSIAPIFADHCASCHNVGGPGSVLWQLVDAADLVSTHDWLATVVDIGYMPPWPASDLSLVFHDNRSLRPDEIEAIRQWSAAGAPLDVDPSTAIVASDGVAALDADVELVPHESFQGSSAVADDYRCLVYDPELTESQWLKGFEFVPDQTTIVHHAIGYLAPGAAMDQALQLSAEDDLGGWQCYGSSGLDAGDDLFLGWAPGQLPTEFPDGSGLRAEPGDFIVLQIHYHFETAEGPEDSSTIRIDWAEGDTLDPIEFDEFIGPAEIPCAFTESGPLCDRDVALAAAYERYGIEGVLADGINQVCGVTPEDFAAMNNGIASSSCTIPVRNFGEIVSLFGHEHEIGSAIRLTLNAGRADERILLDIPEWSFDWQYNYYPVESVILQPGDTILLECEWDRSRRSSTLEPAYVLWADGTNDEMCFATIATRRLEDASRTSTAAESALVSPRGATLTPELVACLAERGVGLTGLGSSEMKWVDFLFDRSTIEALVEPLFACEDAGTIGATLAELISAEFGGLVGDDGVRCLAERLASPSAARELLVFVLDDATDAEKQPVGDLVGDCVSLSDALAAFGFPLPEDARACVDEAGRPLLVQATIEGELPEEQTLFRTINPCLTGG